MKLPVSLPLPPLSSGSAFVDAILGLYQRIANAWNNPDFGATADRPALMLSVGQVYFDTTLGIPIWWNGVAWVDATGSAV